VQAGAIATIEADGEARELGCADGQGGADASRTASRLAAPGGAVGSPAGASDRKSAQFGSIAPAARDLPLSAVQRVIADRRT